MNEKKNKTIKSVTKAKVIKTTDASKKNKNKKATVRLETNKTSKGKSFWQNANELTRMIVVFGIVVGVFLVFYVLTSLIKNNTDITPDKDNSVSVIQYDEILVGEILSQKQDTYYVLATFEDDLNLPIYGSYVQSYKEIEKSNTIYTVNLSSVFNKKFISDKNNFNIDQVNEIRFKDATLLKIENNQVTEYFEAKDEIINYLKELTV